MYTEWSLDIEITIIDYLFLTDVNSPDWYNSGIKTKNGIH